MSRFSNPEQFASLIESARSCQRWKDTRTYITLLGEYSTYMSEDQKNLTLIFLYEMLLIRPATFESRRRYSWAAS